MVLLVYDIFQFLFQDELSMITYKLLRKNNESKHNTYLSVYQGSVLPRMAMYQQMT